MTARSAALRIRRPIAIATAFMLWDNKSLAQTALAEHALLAKANRFVAYFKL